MLVAMVCYFGVCIALLFDLRGSAHERRQSATRTVSQEAREAATEWEAALARVSPQRAPTKSSERMASTFDAPSRRGRVKNRNGQTPDAAHCPETAP